VTANITSFGVKAKKDRLPSVSYFAISNGVARVTEATRVTRREAFGSFFTPFFFSQKTDSPISLTLSLETDGIRNEFTVPR